MVALPVSAVTGLLAYGLINGHRDLSLYPSFLFACVCASVISYPCSVNHCAVCFHLGVFPWLYVKLVGVV